MKIFKNKIVTVIIVLFCGHYILAQDKQVEEIVDYRMTKEYEIAEIKVTGIKYLDENVLAQLSGLSIGQKIEIPGDAITKALKKYWKQGLFSDVKIAYTKIEGKKIYLNIYLKERPRLASITFEGIKKSDEDELNEKLELKRGSQITDNLLNNTTNIIKDYFLDKGFYNTEVDITYNEDSVFQNTVNLLVKIDRSKRVKIKEIYFVGASAIKHGKLRRTMKETKRKRPYNLSKPSKYIPKNLKTDKKSIIEKYNEIGYKDAKIIRDSIIKIDEKNLILILSIDEGRKYYYRDITWIGNSRYSADALNRVLKISKGDVFDQSLLDKRLFIDEDAISTIYLDDGYLFFSVTPVEVIEGDSINMEMRVYEGEQATIENINIQGNDKTNEHVIRRELRSRPADLFSKTNITRSIRELANLGHFDPEKLDVSPIPDPVRKTVDLNYIVEERANDQLEVSGGYGGKMFIGTIGLRFSNFSTRNMFEKKAWRPLPSGDGQTLSLRMQTTGKMYQSYNVSFMEPWFGGKKPNSFSVSFFHLNRNRFPQNETAYNPYSSYYGYGYNYGYNLNFKEKPIGHFRNTGVSIGLGRRLQWPDDYFTLYNELSFQRYNLDNYGNIFSLNNNGNGIYKIVSFNTVLGRNSVDQMIYPRRGSNFTFGLELTPPYSIFRNLDYTDPTLADSIKHSWVEFHKWTFKTEWYKSLVGNLVLATKTNFGFLSYYNEDLGYSPFEGYDVGVDPMQAYYTYGRESIPVRGYKNGEISPAGGANLYNKYTMELRYPISLNPSATVYVHAFGEAANAWGNFADFNPFIVKRTAGIGVRAFLPMFGLLGIDWGYRFDDVVNKYGDIILPGRKGEFHFVIGQNF
ncbi:outer membrane protein assembly factor BamA [Bacteroidota bacterium]